MLINRWAFVLLVVLGILIAGTSWYSVRLGIIRPVVIADIAQTADAYGLSIVTTGNDGSLSYDGQADHATQTGTGLIDFYNLKARSYGETNVVWWLYADQGEVSQDHQQIDLSGHVKLIRVPNDPKTPHYIFTTNSATIYPKTKIVQGSDWLTITQEGAKNVLIGKGFIANMATKTFQLLGQVQGTYFVQQQQQQKK